MRPIFDRTHGTLDWYCIDYWSRELALDIAALKRAVRHQIAWLPESRGFLAKLRASGRRMVLVTNAHPEIARDQGRAARHPAPFRRGVHLVHDGRAQGVGGFLAAPAKAEPFDQRRTLFVDDSHAVLRAAQGAWHRLDLCRAPARAGRTRARGKGISGRRFGA